MVTRYSTQECCIGFETVWESEKGDYVLYEDHVREVDALKAEIHKARSEGAKFGQEAGFRMGLSRAIRLVDIELAK